MGIRSVIRGLRLLHSACKFGQVFLTHTHTACACTCRQMSRYTYMQYSQQHLKSVLTFSKFDWEMYYNLTGMNTCTCIGIFVLTLDSFAKICVR